MQTEFAIELLKEAKNRGITTAIETCGAIPWERCHEVYDYLDFIPFAIAVYKRQAMGYRSLSTSYLVILWGLTWALVRR